VVAWVVGLGGEFWGTGEGGFLLVGGAWAFRRRAKNEREDSSMGWKRMRAMRPP